MKKCINKCPPLTFDEIDISILFLQTCREKLDAQNVSAVYNFNIVMSSDLGNFFVLSFEIVF